MSDDETTTVSVRDRIARLQIDHVGRTPLPSSTAPPAPSKPARFGRPLASPPLPPTPPTRPQPQTRPLGPPPSSRYTQTSSAPTTSSPGSASTACSFGMDGISRPSLPPRNSTQSSIASVSSPPLPPRHSPLASPALPPRSSPLASPNLPPRRPSTTFSQSGSTLSRRLSNDSLSSIATTQSSISACSLAAPGQRYAMRAPSFDAASLPALPPKRTEAQKEAYYRSGEKQFTQRRPPRGVRSSPAVPTITTSAHSMESVADEDLAAPRPDLMVLQASKPRNWS